MERVLIAILVTITIFFVSISQSIAQEEPSAQNDQAHIQLPQTETNRFATAIYYVRHYYIDQVKDRTLFNNAIQGMLSNLDPHSAFLDKKSMKKLKSATTGKFGGIGIKIAPDKRGALRVIAPIDDTPAKKAGIKPGDLIVKINDQIVQDLTLQEAVNKIRGKKGTYVNLIIIRKDQSKPVKMKIKRSTIHIETVKSKVLPHDFGYARITFFQKPAKKDLKQAIKKLRKQSNNELNGLVLDLRGNPGGLLRPALDVADMFLDANKLQHNKLLVYTKGRLKKIQVRAKAHEGDILNGKPIVVLINQGTASGSEIVSGALQDHKRALILGEKSFGKGSVQSVFPIGKNSGMKLTTALYYTPNGRSIQAEGIRPDIQVAPLEVKYPDDIGQDLLSEASLQGHLPNGSDKHDGHKKQTSQQEKKNMNDLAQDDYQLYQAIQMLLVQQLKLNGS